MITELIKKKLDEKLAKKKHDVIALKWENVSLEKELKKLKEQSNEKGAYKK